MKLAMTMAVLGLVAGCGMLDSDAYKAYLAFTPLVREGNCMKLSPLVAAGSPAEGWLNDYCGPRGAAKMVADLSGSPAAATRRFKHTLVSESSGDDGLVTLVVIEHAVARPSNFSSPPPDYRQTLKMKKEGEVWKVSDYKDEEVKE